MSRDSNELSELRDQLSKLSETKNALSSACDGDTPGGLNDDEGEGARGLSGAGQGNGRGLGGQGQGSGQRADGSQGKIRSFEAKENGEFNPKGQKHFDGFVPGQAYKKKTGVELAGEIRQAAQIAPEAIETQRIPKAARDMAKGYFKNLSGQADAPKSAPPKTPTNSERKDKASVPPDAAPQN
jgi:hypothetical protein